MSERDRTIALLIITFAVLSLPLLTFIALLVSYFMILSLISFIYDASLNNLINFIALISLLILDVFIMRFIIKWLRD